MNAYKGVATWFDSGIVGVTTQKNTEATNRYKDKFLIEEMTNGTHLSFMRKKDIAIPERDEDQFFFVSAKYEYRPDILAYNVYGSPLYYWVILAANNMKSFWDLKVNLTIRIPDIASVLEV